MWDTGEAKVNGYKFTMLLPPPKGSGFPPMTFERILVMKREQKVILPEYCGACGSNLEGGVTCPICGVRVLYADKMIHAYKKEMKQNEKKRWGIRIGAILIALLVIGNGAIIIANVSNFIKKIQIVEGRKMGSENLDEKILIKEPTPKPTVDPTATPTVDPTATPTPKPTKIPTPTKAPTPIETVKPTQEPTVEPTEKPIVAEKIELPSACQIEKDTSVTLPIKTTPAGCKYTISSSNSSIVSVHGKKIKGKKEGTAVITVTSGDVSVHCKVTVVSY